MKVSMVVNAYCYFLDYMTKLVYYKGKHFNELESTLDSKLVIYQMDNDMCTLQCLQENSF